MHVEIAVVPVAGLGTRLLPATKSQPKEMLSVGRKPVVQYVVEELALSDIRRVLFVTSRGKTSIEQHFDTDGPLTAYLRETGREQQLEALEFENLGVEYFSTRQREQLGLGHAILCAEPLIGRRPFVVALGDSIIGLHAQSDIVRRMVREFEARQSEPLDMVIAFEEVPRRDVVKYGVARPRGAVDTVFALDDLVEKPTVAEAPSNLAVAARYVFSPRIFDALHQIEPGKGGEIQLTDAVARILRAGGRGLGIKLGANERRFDIGNFDSYFRTFAEFALSDPEYGDAFREHIRRLLGREDA